MLSYRYINPNRFGSKLWYDLQIEDDGVEVRRVSVGFSSDAGAAEMEAFAAAAIVQATEIQQTRYPVIVDVFRKRAQASVDTLLQRLEQKDLYGFFASLPVPEIEVRILAAMEEVISALESAGQTVLARLPDKANG